MVHGMTWTHLRVFVVVKIHIYIALYYILVKSNNYLPGVWSDENTWVDCPLSTSVQFQYWCPSAGLINQRPLTSDPGP
jgi:hypothetical protein